MSMHDYLRRSRHRRRVQQIRDSSRRKREAALQESFEAAQAQPANDTAPAPANDAALAKDIKVKRTSIDLFLPGNPS